MIPHKIFKKLIFICSALIALITSCDKTQSEIIENGQAQLTVNLEGFDFESESELLANTKNEDNTVPTHIQHSSNGLQVESQLIPLKNNNVKNSLNKSSSAVLMELANGIQYTLLVYHPNGNLAARKDFVYGTETTSSSVTLGSGIIYTFIVVSSRSKTSLPTIVDISTLSTSKILNVNADLLYTRIDRSLNVGQNYLAAKLKPQFSEVTTTIKMDQTMTGLITAITNPVFKPVVQNVSLQLNNGALTYGATNSLGKSFSFPSLGSGVRSVTTNTPTTLIHAATETGTLNLPSLTVDGETKANINVNGIKIKAGHRYNLILTLKTCTEAVNGLNGFNWEYSETTKTINEGSSWWPNYVTYKGIDFIPQGSNTTTFKKNGEIISFQFSEAGADYGFVYDIMELDNAFNLEINGQTLVGNSVTSGEIQFQNNATSTTQNIEFEDGSQYQTIGNTSVSANKRVKAIWELKGTVAKPIVRVVIGRNGDVLIYGSKTNEGELFPLRLKNNAQFNIVTWKGGNQTNIIKATTRVEGKTVMKSSGSGRKKIPCP